MNSFLTILLGAVSVLGLPTLLIGLFALTAGRKTAASEPGPGEDSGAGVAGSTADRCEATEAVDLRLTAVLAESGEVLLGYRTGPASAAGLRSPTEVVPLATEILLVRPDDEEDRGGALLTLDHWCNEGVELAMRSSDHGDVFVLSDPRSPHRLILRRLWAPCD